MKHRRMDTNVFSCSISKSNCNFTECERGKQRALSPCMSLDQKNGLLTQYLFIFNFGPPKENIFLTTIYGLYMSPVSPIFHIVSTVNSWFQTCSWTFTTLGVQFKQFREITTTALLFPFSVTYISIMSYENNNILV